MLNPILKIRKAAGMTQAELAGKVGASRYTLAGWETGKRSPRGDELTKLSVLLNTTPNELTGFEPPAARAE